MLKLSRGSVESLCSFVDELVRSQGCDHTHRFSREWAATAAIGWDDLLDLLEQNGGYCDCEVVLNLPEEVDLELEAIEMEPAGANPHRLRPTPAPVLRPFSSATVGWPEIPTHWMGNS